MMAMSEFKTIERKRSWPISKQNPGICQEKLSNIT